MTDRQNTTCEELTFARQQTDELFNLISEKALYSRPVQERHRLIFYFGHFEAFDWNLLARRGMSERSFHPEFDRLFERGIDPEPGRAPLDSPRDWPSREQVERYGRLTRRWIDDHINELDSRLVRMAIEHRLMHAETFAYMMHNLPYAEKRDPDRNQIRNHNLKPGGIGTNPLIEVGAAIVTLGNDGNQFGWDNEHSAHNVAVPSFAISKYKVSNGEYLEFVRQGGPPPHFWSREGEDWFYAGMFERIPLPLDYPVWVTWHQADAFAKWRGRSLPSEAQFQRAANLRRPDSARDNFSFHQWDPIPVNTDAESTTPAQMTGNGWEWTRDLFAPFSGFEADPLYPGYSADFFDGRHYVMKGASPRTSNLLTRPSFRNWFRPDYPYVYAAFRLVENQ